MPLMPALRSQRQAYLCEFETNLVYRVSRATQRTCLQKRRKERRKEGGKTK